MRRAFISVVAILIPLIIIAAFLYSSQMDEVESIMSEADYFKEIKKPFVYYEAYAKKDLIGYCFYTKDVTPEEKGYDGPIEMVVAIDKTCRIKHLKVLKCTDTIESARAISGQDFLNQFKAKGPKDGFIVGADVDGITHATVSSTAVASTLKKALTRMEEAVSGKKVETLSPEIQKLENKGLQPKEAKYYKIIE